MRSMKRIGTHIVKAVNIKTVLPQLMVTKSSCIVSSRQSLTWSVSMVSVCIDNVVDDYVDDRIDVSIEASHGSTEGKWCEGKSTHNVLGK